MIKTELYKTGVSFRPETKAVIDSVNKRMGFYNFSAALRYIVHDWARAQGIDPEKLLAQIEADKSTLPQPEAQK